MKYSLQQLVTARFEQYKEKKIPWIVRLVENPASPLSFPGQITLYNHDCLHILLCLDLSLKSEAFIIGLCMGSDRNTRKFHVSIFKFISKFLYPKYYRFEEQHFVYFDSGFNYGRKLEVKFINKVDFFKMKSSSVESIRKCLGIRLIEVNLIQLKYFEKTQLNHTNLIKSKVNQNKCTKILRISGSICAIIGGTMLASNSNISPYGFIPLAASSLQWLISSILEKDVMLAFNSGSLFLFVDLLGIYRWLLA